MSPTHPHAVPNPQKTAKDVNVDALSADDTGEVPELGELGTDDIISDDPAGDGATQIMTRAYEPPPAPPASKKSALDALAATIPAKGRTLPPSMAPSAPTSKKPPMPPMANANVAPIPATMVSATSPAPAPVTASKVPTPTPTAPLPPDVDDDSDEKRVDRTQPFDRSRIFGANDAAVAAQKPGSQTQPSAPAPSAVLAAIRPTPVPRFDVAPVSHAPNTPRLPNVIIAEPTPAPPPRPASIAPIAIDIPRAEATQKFRAQTISQAQAYLQPPPRLPMNQTPLFAAAIAGGVALFAAAIVAIVAVGSGDDATSTTSTTSATTSKPAPVAVVVKPREPSKGTARSAIIETPETTPSRAAPAARDRDDDGTPVVSVNSLSSAPGSGRSFAAASNRDSSDAPAAATPPPSTGGVVRKEKKNSLKEKEAASAAPAAPEPPVAAAAPAAPPPAPRPAGPTPTTGTIVVPGSLMTVMVDGDYRRVQGGQIVVSCGRHRVNAGRGTQMVDVPCGGSANVQ